MKKWFNTNYYYIVPKFEKDTQVKLAGQDLDEFQEAKELDWTLVLSSSVHSLSFTIRLWKKGAWKQKTEAAHEKRTKTRCAQLSR